MYGPWLSAAFLLCTSEPQCVYLSADIRALTKFTFSYTVRTRTTHGCLHLFRARTAETTFVDMTLGCARMWIAHTEFHTCRYATGQNVRQNHEWPDKCFVRSVNVQCLAVISHTEPYDQQIDRHTNELINRKEGRP